ncbi:hypothetical protein CPC08DRAFT_213736 [Agrocybe pediades]|nr:hypothetical protein CPC08DRAFT_213736 [Agrocybe pediades]
MFVSEDLYRSLLGRDIKSDSELALLNQSLRITANVETGHFKLLSVFDSPISLGNKSTYDDFSAYQNVQILSESITFTGDLLSPKGILISCNDILSSKAVVNTTGTNGADQVIGGSAAKPGDNGGPIKFYIQNGTVAVSNNLSFVAEGGTGGGVTVANSQGGAGGNGGIITRIFQSCYTNLVGFAYQFLDENNVPDDILQFTSVRRNDPSYILALQLLKHTSNYPIDEGNISSRVDGLRQLLIDIDNGVAATVYDLVVKVRLIRNAVEAVVTQQKDAFSVSAYYKGGYGGAGNGIGTNGPSGQPGSDVYYVFSKYDPGAQGRTAFAYANPEQCAMLLERGKIFYYMGSPVLLGRAANIFQRLVDRLCFLSVDLSGIYEADEAAKLQSIRTDAANMLIQLSSGVSYNGHEYNWAPRASYTIYEQVLNIALDDNQAFENAYIQYHVALDKQEKLTASVNMALQQTTQMIGSLNTEINDLVAQLKDTENRLIQLTDPVKITHSILMGTFERLKDRIQNHFELSVPQLLNALTKMAATPTGVVAGNAGLGLVFEGFNSVPDVNGVPANKDYIIKQILYGEATVKSIDDTLDKNSLNGEFVVDDPFGTRLMVARDDLMHFLDAYASSNFADVIDEIKGDYDAFIEAILARNEQAVLYNMQLKVYVEMVASRAEYQAMKNNLQGKEIEANDPGLAIITTYMDSVYQSSRARVLNYLDRFVRSLNFRMLTTFDIFQLAFGGGDADSVPQSITNVAMRSARSRIQDAFLQTVEIWGSEPARFPADFNNPRGKRIYLDEKSLSILKTEHQVTVNIPVTYKDPTIKNEFTGCCNIRVYRARFGLTGLVAKKSAYVGCNLVHTGKEVLVDRQSVGLTFVHDPISITYSYVLSPDGTINVLDNGNLAEADVDEPAKSYAAPGAFPVEGWKVDLRASALEDLDFSGVTEAYFDFCGTNYAF